MYRHYHKKHFPALGLAVVIMEVVAFITFVIGAGVMVYGMLEDIEPNSLVITTFSFIFAAFVLFAMGELVQLLMKIEVNTRKNEKDMKALIKDVEKDLNVKIRK